MTHNKTLNTCPPEMGIGTATWEHCVIMPLHHSPLAQREVPLEILLSTNDIQISSFKTSNTQEVIRFFLDVFSASENKQEGESIAHLVSNLISKTPSGDLYGFIASMHETIIGSIFFSRITTQDSQSVFILSPVAISTACQGQGIGQKLIEFGLAHLKTKGVEIALTYGDPAFYSKVGFKQISADEIMPPYQLSQPIGWLAQSLSGNTIPRIKGKINCVQALDTPDYW